MSFPSSILADPAFNIFFSSVAIVSGDRSEKGSSVSRPLSLTVPCCVETPGEPIDASNNAIAPTVELSYTVLIRRADWPDHLPPQSGDSLTIDGYPLMRVLTSIPLGDSWSVACRSKGGAE